jgi:phospholipid/cholesterol/gamma-HCH transport system substrate-binding protein
MGQAVKVGIFATFCLVVLAVLIWKIEDINPFTQKGMRIGARFDTVAGLDDKASVRLAGVKVGKVDGIGLEGRRAHVSLLLDRPLPLTAGTTARISNMGLLGDKYVELVPGPPGAPLLPPGAVIEGRTPPSFDQAMEKLNSIGDSIQKVTGTLAGGDVGGSINRLVADLQATSAEIRALVAENRANVADTVRNFDRVGATLSRELPRIADQMNRALAEIHDVVAENRGDLSASMGNIREVTGKLQTSVDNLNKISDKIARGEGTIGKLVNSEEAYNGVVSTLDSIKGGVDTLAGTLGAIRRFRIDLDLQAAALQHGDSLSSLHLDIDPQDGKHLYRAGLSLAPEGKRHDKTQAITITDPDGTTHTTTVRTLTTETEYNATGLFGFHGPRDVRLWAGVIEGHGGAQVEYPLFDHRFWLSFEAFDFNRPQNQAAHLRLTGRWQLHPNLYLVAGSDDPLERDSLFVGGGIRWTDDNLKYLLGSLPKF